MGMLAPFGVALIKAYVLTVMAAPMAMTACVDDRPWLPYTNPDLKKPGTMQVLVAQVAAELGVALEVRALPWRRCQQDVRTGKVDAVIGAADVPFNRELAEFPLAGGEVDQQRALGVARVVLAKRVDSPVDWDGQTFHLLTTPVGTAAGTQIMIEQVKRHGGRADEGARTDERNLEKLLAKRIDLMAAYDLDLQPLLSGKYQGKVVVLPIPLSETSYYLVFAKKFAVGHQDLVQRFWHSLAATKKRPGAIKAAN